MVITRLLAEGLSNKAIARRLGISVHTAKFHVGSVHKNEFSFLNFILVVTAKRAPISETAMPALGFQSGRRLRAKEYPHVT